MSRLIDADGLRADIKRCMPTGGARGVFLSFVDDAPTAYDVEAVVKQIEEWNKVTGAIPENSTWYYELISIIERGGVNQQRNDTKKPSVKKIVIRPGNRTIYVCTSCNTPVVEGSEHCYHCKRKIDWSVEK